MSETPARLSQDEIEERVRSLTGWQVEAGKLVKAYSFDDFMGAVGFVDRLAPVAEAEGHHPDLEVGWGRVVVKLSTHSAGGLTEQDFSLASRLDQLQP